MRIIAALAALALAACTQQTPAPDAQNAAPTLPSVTLPIADQAGNRMEALTQNETRWCTSDSVWCIDGASVTASFMPTGPAIALPAEGEVWPVIVRSGESALVGIITTNSQMYSGGGSAAKVLTLYEVAEGVAREAARMPYSGEATIRACFDEGDETTRAGACHDEYKFVTRISMDETVASGSPVLTLQTAAGSYPGPLTRMEDSTARGALTEADLVWAQDAECTFSRTYARGDDGLYTPDQPLPGCPDYLEP